MAYFIKAIFLHFSINVSDINYKKSTSRLLDTNLIHKFSNGQLCRIPSSPLSFSVPVWSVAILRPVQVRNVASAIVEDSSDQEPPPKGFQ